MKSNNKYLVEIIEKLLEYLSEYNEFNYLFIKNKSAFILFEHQF